MMIMMTVIMMPQWGLGGWVRLMVIPKCPARVPRARMNLSESIAPRDENGLDERRQATALWPHATKPKNKTARPERQPTAD